MRSGLFCIAFAAFAIQSFCEEVSSSNEPLVWSPLEGDKVIGESAEIKNALAQAIDSAAKSAATAVSPSGELYRKTFSRIKTCLSKVVESKCATGDGDDAPDDQSNNIATESEELAASQAKVAALEKELRKMTDRAVADRSNIKKLEQELEMLKIVKKESDVLVEKLRGERQISDQKTGVSQERVAIQANELSATQDKLGKANSAAANAEKIADEKTAALEKLEDEMKKCKDEQAAATKSVAEATKQVENLTEKAVKLAASAGDAKKVEELQKTLDAKTASCKAEAEKSKTSQDECVNGLKTVKAKLMKLNQMIPK